MLDDASMPGKFLAMYPCTCRLNNEGVAAAASPGSDMELLMSIINELRQAMPRCTQPQAIDLLNGRSVL